MSRKHSADDLLDRTLYGILFEHSYLVLVFDDYRLTFYSLPHVVLKDESRIAQAELEYAGHLRALIGRRVVRIWNDDDRFEIVFGDVLLQAGIGEHSTAKGPEAMHLHHYQAGTFLFW